MSTYLPWLLRPTREGAQGGVPSTIQVGAGGLCAAAAAKSLQSCPTLCAPIDSSPPGSAIPGILQARTLEWVAILQMVTAAMKLKDAYSLEEKLRPTKIAY